MSTLHALYHLALADVRERVRGYAFLLTLLFAVALLYFFVPALDAPLYAILNLGGYRPLYNSAWIGTMATLLMTEFMLLFGFYLIKGTLARDLHTGVRQLLVATPLPTALYTLGKWLSNAIVLSMMVLVMVGASALLQLLRAEVLIIDLWALAAPFLIVLWPALLFVAALAVLFESIPLLRGGVGSVVYFFVYAFLATLTDWQGVDLLWPSVYRACSAHFPHCNGVRQIDIDAVPLTGLPTFRYPGAVWGGEVVLQRLIWVGAALGVALLAAYLLRRSDVARVGPGLLTRLWRRIVDFISVEQESSVEARPTLSPVLPASGLTPLSGQARTDALGPLVVAEARLALRKRSLWWYVGALCLLAVSVWVPLEIAQGIILPLAWIWPLLLWSGMGARETRWRTESLIFSTPHPIGRQLLAVWLVGVGVALLMGSGVILRLLLAARWITVLATGVGVLFVPTLALIMGCWSRQSKLFEGFYLFFWYLAAVQNVPYFDFMGRFPQAVAWGLPWVYAGLTVVLFGGAVLGRRRQLRQ